MRILCLLAMIALGGCSAIIDTFGTKTTTSPGAASMPTNYTCDRNGAPIACSKL